MQIHRRSDRPAARPAMIASRYRAADILFRRRGGGRYDDHERFFAAASRMPRAAFADCRTRRFAPLSVFVNLSVKPRRSREFVLPADSVASSI